MVLRVLQVVRVDVLPHSADYLAPGKWPRSDHCGKLLGWPEQLLYPTLVACIASFLLRLGRHGSPLKDGFVAQSTPEYSRLHKSARKLYLSFTENAVDRFDRHATNLGIGCSQSAQSTRSRQLLYRIGCLAGTRFPN